MLWDRVSVGTAGFHTACLIICVCTWLGRQTSHIRFLSLPYPSPLLLLPYLSVSKQPGHPP
nr:hypothetical protein Q903MT_gene889 [Picea sitchensis]